MHRLLDSIITSSKQVLSAKQRQGIVPVRTNAVCGTAKEEKKGLSSLIVQQVADCAPVNYQQNESGILRCYPSIFDGTLSHIRINEGLEQSCPLVSGIRKASFEAFHQDNKRNSLDFQLLCCW